MDIVDESADVEKLVIDEQNALLLHQLVDQLEDIYRDIIVMKYFLEINNSEISKLLNVFESLVRMRLTRAQHKLLLIGGERFNVNSKHQ